MVYLMDQLGEIGLHTVSHATQKYTYASAWSAEMRNNLYWIRNYSTIPSVNTSRSPYLAYSPMYFDTIKALNI